MTIEKRGSKWRIKEMVNGKYVYVNVDFDPNKNKRKAHELLEDRKRSAAPIVKKHTFAWAYTQYVSVKKNVLSPSTLKGYKQVYNSLPEYIKDSDLDDFNDVILQRFVNDFASTHAPKTTKNAWGLVSAVLKMFFPALDPHVTLPQKEVNDIYIPTDEEVKAIFSYVKGTDFEIPFALATLSLRRSEMAAITSDDLDGNLLHVRKSKVLDENNKWVTKPFTKNSTSTRDILIPEYLADLIREKGVAFSGHPNNISKHLAIVQRKLGIKHFSYHKLRHYFASYCHNIGMTDAQIMQMGGWSTDNVMKTVYRHAMDIEESQQKAASHIASFLG